MILLNIQHTMSRLLPSSSLPLMTSKNELGYIAAPCLQESSSFQAFCSDRQSHATTMWCLKVYRFGSSEVEFFKPRRFRAAPFGI